MLPAEEPIPQLVVDRCAADAPGGKVLGDFLLELGGGQPAIGARVDRRPIGHEGRCHCLFRRERAATPQRDEKPQSRSLCRQQKARVRATCCRVPHSLPVFQREQGDAFAARINHCDDRQPELLGKLEIPRVVGGHGHDRPRAVADEHIVGHPDGNRLAIDGVNGVRAGEHARLFLGQIGAVEVALAGQLLAVGPDRGRLLRHGEPLDKRMLRRDHHVRGAEERVGPGSVNPQHLLVRLPRPAGNLPIDQPALVFLLRRTAVLVEERADKEIDLRPRAAADPVPLQELDALGPVELVEVFFQPVGIGGNAEHPLPQRDADDRMPAALTHAADDLLVGQHGAQCRAPIHRGFELVGQAVLVAIAFDGQWALVRHFLGDGQLGDGPAALLRFIEPGIEQQQEDALRPAEIARVGGGHLPLPIVGEAEHLQLAAEIGDVLFGGGAGMGAGFFGMLFGGEPEGVPAHGVHDAGALHAMVAADDVGGRVAFGVPDVQAVAAGVGEHVQHVQLAILGELRARERAVRFPKLLPFWLDNGRIIARHGEWLQEPV